MLDSVNTKHIKDLSIEDVSEYGSKAVMLGLLISKGFFVPDGFCISTRAFNRHFENMEGFKDSNNSFSVHPEELKTFVKKHKMCSSLLSEIGDRTKSLIDSGVNEFAVRSSAIDEDLSSGSFAGVYSTTLNVNSKNEMSDAIISTWCSYFSKAAHYYRSRKAINDLNGMSILIQEMIKPRFSGILFTNWIYSLNEKHCLIETVSGDARNLVDGQVSGKRLLVNRKNFNVLSNQTKVVLKDRLLAKRLVRAGIEIESFMGSPQDIEWCVDHQQKLWILQTRPITEMSNQSRMLKGNFQQWERANQEPFSTLGCNLAVVRYLNWVKAINRYYLLNFKPKVRVKNNIVFHTVPWDRKNSFIRGWMLVFDLLRWINRKHLLKQYLLKELHGYDRKLSNIRANDPSKMADEELHNNFSLAVYIYLDSQHKSFAIGRLASFSAHALKPFLRYLTSLEESVNSILSGLENITISRDILFEEMAQEIVKQLPNNKVNINSFNDLLEALPKTGKGKMLATRLKDFRENFEYIWADRYPRDPGWKFSKDKFSLALKEYSTRENTLKGRMKKLRSERNQRITQFERYLKNGMFGNVKLRFFRSILKDIEIFFPHKEKRNHFVYYTSMLIRALGKETGKRLSMEGIIEQPTDIFFLTLKEIISITNHQGSTTWAKEIVERRKFTYEKSLKSIELRKSMYDHDYWSSLNQGKIEMVGDGCSPGFHKATARVIRGIRELDQIVNGEILVCKIFRPVMSPILSNVGGLIVESGSVISHGAILSREYGVPAVFNVENITRLVNNGNTVSLDGDTGIVKLYSNDFSKNTVQSNNKIFQID